MSIITQGNGNLVQLIWLVLHYFMLYLLFRLGLCFLISH
uniref:Uncharacterized protein n=1 Tax=Rhizophora mucronata TaxID=61149 RepID=A0A2P2NJG5_RHIMU